MDGTLGLVSRPIAEPGSSPDRDREQYNQRGVLVTSSRVSAYGRNYPVTELRHIRTMRGPHTDLTVTACLVAVAMVVVTARVWEYLSADGWVGVVTVLCMVAGLAAAGAVRRRRPYFMIAEFRGRTVLLAWEEDPTRYGEISRAVQRARENCGR